MTTRATNPAESRPAAALAKAAAHWDAAAAAFDDEPDHGLRDPVVRSAWQARLAGWLPRPPGDVLDLGCGTGSVAALAAARGHRVTGVDVSPRMADRARAKLAGTGAEVLVGDAAAPPVAGRLFDAVMARHVLWALPDPEAVLRRWVSLLRPGGHLVLVEGVWGGAGLPAPRVTGALAALAPRVAQIAHVPLSGDEALWGGPVADDRYAVTARSAAPAAA